MSFHHARLHGRYTGPSASTRRCADIPLLKSVARQAQPSQFISTQILDACRNHAARLEAVSQAYGFSCYHEAKVSLKTRRLGRFDDLGPDHAFARIEPAVLRHKQQELRAPLRAHIDACFRAAHHGPIDRKRLITGILTEVRARSADALYDELTDILMNLGPSSHFNALVEFSMGDRLRENDMWVDRAIGLLGAADQVAHEIVLRDQTGALEHSDIVASYVRTPADVFRMLRRCHDEHMMLPVAIGFHESLPGFSLPACIAGEEQKLKTREQLGFLTMQFTQSAHRATRSRSPR